MDYRPGFLNNSDLKLEKGQRVCLKGLKKASYLNGRSGVVIGDKDPKNGRFAVQLDGLYKSLSTGKSTYAPITVQEENLVWNAQSEIFEAEVRLIRYGAVLEHEEARGLLLDALYIPKPTCCYEESYYELATQEKDADKDYRKDTSGNDDFLTDAQLKALDKSFSKGFYAYCKSGVAPGLTGSLPGTSDTRVQKCEMSEKVIEDQCRELYDRYVSEGGPLPGITPDEARLSSSKNNNNNRKKNHKKKGHHADSIAGYIHDCCCALDKHFTTPSTNSAHIIHEIARMLLAAVRADPDVARAFNSDGKIILRLRERSLEFAKATDADPSRSSFTADRWWLAFGALTTLAAEIIGTLASLGYPDDVLASEFFESMVAPALLKSAASPLAAERAPSLMALSRAACAVPPDRSISLVRNKAKWEVLEAACSLPACVAGSPHAQKREDRMAPNAAARATFLLAELCRHGMHGDALLLVPGDLAFKMIRKGVVPLLVSLSRSPIETVATAAIAGLGEISRVKDCRQILFQEPGGVELVQDMLGSTNGLKVSNAMPLVVHLLWDEEWHEPLLSIQPPIETTAVKWAAYGMKLIREKAARIREDSKKAASQNDFMWFELDTEKATHTLETMWFELDTEKATDTLEIKLLHRSMILLNTMLRSSNAVVPARLARANAFGLVAVCLDIPVKAVWLPAMSFLCNFTIRSAGATLSASFFPDPDQVLRSVLSKLSRAISLEISNPNQQEADDNATSLTSSVIMNFREGSDWAPVFDNLAKRDAHAKFLIECVLPRWMAEAASANLLLAPRATEMPKNYGIPEKCAEPTGKMLSCEYCGKMEGKKGDHRWCGGCHVVVYCGRDCQEADWKRHKKECNRKNK